jgi:hypothetical protein
MARLTLTYRYDGTPKLILDDFGRLSMSVDTEHFAGRGGFWVQWQDVREFGERLKTYPIQASSPIAAQWGYEMQEGDDLILRIEVAPANATGDLRVSVEIADDTHDYGPRERVRCSFLTNYPQVEGFSSAIAQLMDGDRSEAILEGR